jgi:energy-coupling factor transporter ATP-binding protein EcfA2
MVSVTRPWADPALHPETDPEIEDGERPKGPVPPIPRGIPPRLTACIARLDEGIAAARVLGLDPEQADATRREVAERLGLATDVCVVALIGGTGVGKSTLLNALAGSEVSPASVRRPTTGKPVAWIPAVARDELAPLLGWLGVEEVREHGDTWLPSVAILDLPDLDSIARGHREQVEDLLTRVDAVVWLSDPEKYRDAVLHDDFLRRWLPRLDRQLVALNKADRLGASDVEPVRRDLERSLVADMPDATRAIPNVVAIAAANGDIKAIRSWLEEQADAKRVILGRIASSVVSALDDLAGTAGVDPDKASKPILDPGDRTQAIDVASAEVLRLVDLRSAEAQAVAATRAAARPKGAGPVGRILGWFYKSSGRESRVADPTRFLHGWTERGSLAPALEALRGVVDRPLREAPPGIRPAVAASTDSRRLAVRLRGAVDAAIASRGELEPPTSRVWPALGVAQTVATGLTVIAIAWIVLLVLLRPPVDVVTLPVLGPVPIPFMLLVLGLVLSFIIARALAMHAGWLGAQWARALASDLRGRLERAVADEAFSPLDRVDNARRSLWQAARGARDACGQG